MHRKVSIFTFTARVDNTAATQICGSLTVLPSIPVLLKNPKAGNLIKQEHIGALMTTWIHMKNAQLNHQGLVLDHKRRYKSRKEHYGRASNIH